MEEKFKCDWPDCGAEFETSTQLRGHMMHHKSQRGRTEEKNDRKKRVPMGVPHRKLAANKIPGKRTRWINDNWRKDPSRIQKALDGGYEFVDRGGQTIGDGAVDGNQDLGSRVSRVVGSNPDGTPITAYLMAIDEKWYEEDQKEKQKEVDRTDAAIKRGENKNTLGKSGYVAGIEYNPGGPE